MRWSVCNINSWAQGSQKRFNNAFVNGQVLVSVANNTALSLRASVSKAFLCLIKVKRAYSTKSLKLLNARIVGYLFVAIGQVRWFMALFMPPRKVG